MRQADAFPVARSGLTPCSTMARVWNAQGGSDTAKGVQVLRQDAHELAARAVDVGDEKEGEGQGERQDEGKHLPRPARAIAEQKVLQIAMTAMKLQAPSGRRFHHSACVQPCEFSTSFIPSTTCAAIGVGFAAAKARTAAQSSP